MHSREVQSLWQQAEKHLQACSLQSKMLFYGLQVCKFHIFTCFHPFPVSIHTSSYQNERNYGGNSQNGR